MTPVRLAQWLRLSAPCTAVSARVPAATHGLSEGALSPGFCRNASGYWTEGNNLQYLELPSANGVCAWPSGRQERGRVNHAAATPGLKGIQQGNPHSQQTRGDQK